MGTRKLRERQEGLWYQAELPTAPGHPFYKRLNEVLDKGGFDLFCESNCAEFYHEKLGRPSLAPGLYFRVMMIGFFEGLDSERGIAWRLADSLTLRQFLGIGLDERTPDHVTISRTRRLIDAETHQRIFLWVLERLAQGGLIKGKTIGVDSTTLEANAAMKSIVRKETGEDWKEYLERLAKDAGMDNPTAEDLRRFDKQRKDKKVSNDEWESPTDPDSRIAKMKDGTTHLAYKAEHVVDVETDLVLSATIAPANHSDAETLCDSVAQAQLNMQAARSKAEIKEVVADKGYHKASTLELCTALEFRTYIPEPKRRHRSRWADKPAGQREAMYANRRRVRGARSKKLQRLRSELTERTFAHVCETGGARRTWLRGLLKVAKRYLMQVAARNLGLILRKLFGMGTPRGLQGLGGLFWSLYLAMRTHWSRWYAHQIAMAKDSLFRFLRVLPLQAIWFVAQKSTKTTGC